MNDFLCAFQVSRGADCVRRNKTDCLVADQYLRQNIGHHHKPYGNDPDFAFLHGEKFVINVRLNDSDVSVKSRKRHQTRRNVYVQHDEEALYIAIKAAIHPVTSN